VNLVMISPLYDDKGVVRYFIGAQVDVSALIEEGKGIESFRALLRKDQDDQATETSETTAKTTQQNTKYQDVLSKLQDLSMMFSQDEAEIASRHMRNSDNITETGSLYKSGVPTSSWPAAKRVIGMDEFSLGLAQTNNLGNLPATSSSLPGVYKNYLLVRPYPSLQILFVSPSLRIPGLLRTNLFTKLGGPKATINALQEAFRDGASVTAKILWLPKNGAQDSKQGRPRWIRCTPLLGSDDRVGIGFRWKCCPRKTQQYVR